MTRLLFEMRMNLKHYLQLLWRELTCYEWDHSPICNNVNKLISNGY